MFLKSLEEWTVNRSQILPVVKMVKFDENNMIEVTEEQGIALLQKEMGIRLVKVDFEEKVDDVFEDDIEILESIDKGEEISKVEEIEILEKGEDLEDLPIENNTVSLLDQMSNKELRALVNDFPKEETKQVGSRNSMIEFLKKKLNA